jgi:hypothetical protein
MSAEIIAALRAARAHIADPAKWTQGAMAHDVHGTRCEPNSRAAVKWDAFGAFFAVRPNTAATHAAQDALLAAVPPGYHLISDYNDAAETTHADILALFDSAIAREEAADRPA